MGGELHESIADGGVNSHNLTVIITVTLDIRFQKQARRLGVRPQDRFRNIFYTTHFISTEILQNLPGAGRVKTKDLARNAQAALRPFRIFQTQRLNRRLYF